MIRRYGCALCPDFDECPFLHDPTSIGTDQISSFLGVVLSLEFLISMDRLDDLLMLKHDM